RGLRRGLRQPRPQQPGDRGGRGHRRGLRGGRHRMSLDATSLVPIPVVLPLFGAGLTLALSRRPRAQQLVSITVLAAVAVIAVVLLFASDRNGPQVVWLGGWDQLGIALVADRLASL